MHWQGRQAGQQTGPSVRTAGLCALTPVATPLGWRVAGDLGPGDLMLTMQGTPAPVLTCHHFATTDTAATPLSLWPLRVPAWALENRADLVLLPGQGVMIDCDLAEILYGDPLVVLPAMALEGWRGITRAPPHPGAASVELTFALDVVIYASRSLWLTCPGAPPGADPWHQSGDHSTLSLSQSRHLVACLIGQDAGAALCQTELPPLRQAALRAPRE